MLLNRIADPKIVLGRVILPRGMAESHVGKPKIDIYMYIYICVFECLVFINRYNILFICVVFIPAIIEVMELDSIAIDRPFYWVWTINYNEMNIT